MANQDLVEKDSGEFSEYSAWQFGDVSHFMDLARADERKIIQTKIQDILAKLSAWREEAQIKRDEAERAGDDEDCQYQDGVVIGMIHAISLVKNMEVQDAE